MNTKEIEHNKGATADLLQQKPHVEDANTKTPGCFFRWGEIGCRHLNDWTAYQETLL